MRILFPSRVLPRNVNGVVGSTFVTICARFSHYAAGHTKIARLLDFRYDQEELWRQLFTNCINYWN